MCRINGHSIFSYIAQPWNAAKLYTSNARAKAVAEAEEEAAETIEDNSDGDETADTASTAKLNSKSKKSQTLSSLRIPLESSTVGASVGSSSSLGLNLGGVNIERSFELKDVDKDARGTNDASIFVPGEVLIVYDFKYGKGVAVEAVENKQMLYYAIGAAGGKLMDFKIIELVIIQPRAQHPQGPVRRWVTTPQYVNTFKQELAKRIRLTRTSDKTETGKWCRFCGAKMICPATRTKVNEIARADFQKPMGGNALKTPDRLTPLELKTLLDNAELIERYLEEVREYAFNLLNRGGTVEGYKLVKGGKAHRK